MKLCIVVPSYSEVRNIFAGLSPKRFADTLRPFQIAADF